MTSLTQSHTPTLDAPAAKSPSLDLAGALLRTDRSIPSLILRAALALVIFPHGAQKLFGWFGGYGLEGTMGYFTGTLGVPAPVALLVILGESLGAIALALGLFTRFSAVSLAIIMLGAIGMAHLPHGFFMNWSGQQAGEGFEYHLLVLGMTAALAWAGGGALSLDRWLHGRLAKR